MGIDEFDKRTTAAEMLKMASCLMKIMEKVKNPLGFTIGFSVFPDGDTGVNITAISGDDNDCKHLYSFYSPERNKLTINNIMAAMKNSDFEAFQGIED